MRRGEITTTTHRGLTLLTESGTLKCSRICRRRPERGVMGQRSGCAWRSAPVRRSCTAAVFESGSPDASTFFDLFGFQMPGKRNVATGALVPDKQSCYL